MKNKHYVTVGIVLLLVAAVWYYFHSKNAAPESSFDPNLMIMGGPSFAAQPTTMVAPGRGVGVSAAPVIPGVSRVKYTTEISNKKVGCPPGSHQTQLPNGQWSCISNSN